MLLINLVYVFMLGIVSQSTLYSFSKSINYKYPTIYQKLACIITGLFYCCFWDLYGYSAEFFIYSLCSTLLISISIIDSFYLEIPDEHNLMLFLLGVTYAMLNPRVLTSTITGGLLGGSIYLFLAIISKGGVGGGDIKLAAATGMLLGPKYTIICVYCTFILAITGFVQSVYKAIENKKKDNTKKFELQSEMAFGPYIVTAVLMIFLGLI